MHGRTVWTGIAAVAVLAAVGFAIWGFAQKSDADDTEEKLEAQQAMNAGQRARGGGPDTSAVSAAHAQAASRIIRRRLIAEPRAGALIRRRAATTARAEGETSGRELRRALGNGARTFGANLNRRANNTATCQSLIYFRRVSSCSWSTSGAIRNQRESMIVPGTGRIVQVQVKVGRRTGLMRIAILQALRAENGGEAACCIGQRQTRVFTPRRNGITTLHVNLPVTSTFNPVSRMYAFDQMFLTMVNSRTPIPANVTRNTTTGNCSGGWFPAVRPGQENFTGPYGVCGATILLRATWVPG
jgi:hypothetical protein